MSAGRRFPGDALDRWLTTPPDAESVDDPEVEQRDDERRCPSCGHREGIHTWECPHRPRPRLDVDIPVNDVDPESSLDDIPF